MSLAFTCRVGLIGVAVVGLSGCQCAYPGVDMITFACASQADCADGFACLEGVCRRPDAGTAGGSGGGAGGATAGGAAGATAGGEAGGAGGASGGTAGGASGGTAGGASGGTAGGAGPAVRLAFAAAPPPTFTRRVALPEPPRVLVQDALGRTVTTATSSVALTAYSDPACSVVVAGVVVRPVTPVAAVAGVAVFDSLSLDGTMPVYLGATAAGLTRACAGPAAPGADLFTDQAAARGVADSVSSNYGWVAFTDVDRDGRPDLFAGSNPGPKLFLNRASGPWRPGPALPSTERAIVLGDCNNDGFRDLFVCGGSASFGFMRNARDGGFTDEVMRSQITANNPEGAGVLDFDRDGRLDYLMPSGTTGSMELWRNTGDCVFSNATATAALPDSGIGNGEQIIVVDYDEDGDVDVFHTVSQGLDGGRLYLFRNTGNGTFADVSAAVGLGPAASIDYRAGVAVGDYDNDGDFDLFIGRDANHARSLLRNDPAGFVDVTAQSQDLASEPPFDCEGAAFGDLDNDGLLDLYVAGNGTYDRLFRNQGSGRFIVLTQTGTTDVAADRDSSGVGLADVDLDGDLDVYVNNGGASPSHLYLNRNGGSGYLKVKVVGAGLAGKHPVDGTGAVVQLFDATGTILRASREVSGGAASSQGDPVVHFGLAGSWGGANGPYVLKVRFNSGLYSLPLTVVPATATLIVGGTTLTHTIEVTEP